ncbi:MAG TPA: SCO family protein [Alphaproteobacteria bacterium]|nr:SCO family protein [Alphaproteobacteria bacterium]
MLLALAVLFANAAAAEPLPITLAGPLTLVDADGKTVSTASFAGRWLLVYFGYTHCADWCPTSLSAMAEALDQIGPAAEHVQPLFITVDPARDHGPILRSFAAEYDKRLIGLGGSPEQIAAAANALGVKYEKILLGSDDYVIDHSATLSLIDPSGHHAETFSMAEPYQIAAKLLTAVSSTGASLDNVNNAAAYK